MGLTREAIVQALDTVAQSEPAIARAIAIAGYPEARIRDRGYATLLRTIVGQQVSVAAAAYGGVHVCNVSPGAAPDVLPFTGSLLALAISPDRRWAASGNQDATLHVWRVGKQGEELAMSGYPTKISALAFSPDSKLLASAGGQNVTVWDFSGAGPRGSTPRILSAHAETATALEWSADGSLLAACAADGRAAVWRPALAVPGRPLSASDEVHRQSPATAVCWDRSGRLLVGWSDGTVAAHQVSG